MVIRIEYRSDDEKRRADVFRAKVWVLDRWTVGKATPDNRRTMHNRMTEAQAHARKWVSER